jgi:hypothetical protein
VPAQLGIWQIPTDDKVTYQDLARTLTNSYYLPRSRIKMASVTIKTKVRNYAIAYLLALVLTIVVFMMTSNGGLEGWLVAPRTLGEWLFIWLGPNVAVDSFWRTAWDAVAILLDAFVFAWPLMFLVARIDPSRTEGARPAGVVNLRRYGISYVIALICVFLIWSLGLMSLFGNVPELVLMPGLFFAGLFGLSVEGAGSTTGLVTFYALIILFDAFVLAWPVMFVWILFLHSRQQGKTLQG